MNDQFKHKAEFMIMERINESHAIEGYDMSIKLSKPKLEERCLQILTSRKFKDLLYQREKRNRLTEDKFLKLMDIHSEAKKRSEDPDQYLQSKEISTIIKDYVQQNYEDEKIRKEKTDNYLKLSLSANPEEDSKSFEEFYQDETYHNAKFLKNHLEYFQAHLLKIDKQNIVLIDENKEFKHQMNKILIENNLIKLKLENLACTNNELKIEVASFKSQSTKLLQTKNFLFLIFFFLLSGIFNLKNSEELKIELAEVKKEINEQINFQCSSTLDKIPQIEKNIISLNEKLF